MTAHKTREKNICHSRAELLEIYSLLSEAYAGKIEVPGVEVVSVLDGVEVGWIVVLPGPGNLQSRAIFERIDCCVSIPNARFGDNICDPVQRSGS